MRLGRATMGEPALAGKPRTFLFRHVLEQYLDALEKRVTREPLRGDRDKTLPDSAAGFRSR